MAEPSGMTEELKAKHVGKNIGVGMSDQWECSCGWRSNGYFDGAHWAEQEWTEHFTCTTKEGS